MKKHNAHAMTLLELMIGTLIIIALMAFVYFQIRGLIQRAKVATAKATISAYGLCLGMIRDDTGLYPPKAPDEYPPLYHVQQPQAPSPLSNRDWQGPYGQTISLYDPWGNPYFYELQSIVFGPENFQRQSPPDWVEYEFQVPAGGAGMIVVGNEGVASGSIKINGSEVVTQDDFKLRIPTIVKEVTLNSGTNTISIRLTSIPGITITVSITSSETSVQSTFVLGSWGRDGKSGGSKFDAEILYGDY